MDDAGKELGDRKDELEPTVAAQRDGEAQSATVPVRKRSFLESYQEMEVRQAKARLQGIVKTVHVYNDGRLDFRFR